MSWKMERPEGGFFEAGERAAVAVLFDAILPGDPERGIPGARETGAEVFLDLLLARGEATYHEIPAWRTLYREGLGALRGAAQERFGKALETLDRSEATALLSSLSDGSLRLAVGAVDPRRLFTTLRRHCIQGAFSDPRWGGNANGVMWRWYGTVLPGRRALDG